MNSSSAAIGPDTTVHFRDADRTKDAEAIVKIYVNAFHEQEQFRWIFQTDGDAHRGALRLLFHGRLQLLRKYENTHLMIAHEGEEIIGACGIEPNSCVFSLYDRICAGLLIIALFYGYSCITRLIKLGEELAKDEAPDPRGGKLIMMAVDTKYQGQGIGSKLVEEILRKWDAESGGDLTLTTQLESNVKFYKYYGFETTNETKWDGFTSWSMRRKKTDIATAATATAAGTLISTVLGK